MARAKQILHYTLGCESDEYAVELFDRVEFNWWFTGPLTHSGTVSAIYPRKREIRIRYKDEDDWTRKTAGPKEKVAVVPVSVVSLIARDQ